MIGTKIQSCYGSTHKLFSMAKCVVFDLDDTLYKEIGFVKSAYRFIATKINGISHNELAYNILTNAYTKKLNAFETLNTQLNLDIPITKYLEWYRNHIPDISLSLGVKELLEYLTDNNIEIGLITDGRSISQNNKIESLGLKKYIPKQNIVISEEIGSIKPEARNYKYFMNLYSVECQFYYIGDNPEKDFITPNHLGWKTIGILDNGENIHPQNYHKQCLQPDIWVKDFYECLDIIKSQIS